MPAPLPLEKQLLHLSLAKGVNERDRPETADQETCFTRVENLFHDQTGAHVKRPSLSLLGGITVDALGNDLTNPEIVFPTTGGGLAMIGKNSSVYRYSASAGKFAVSDGLEYAPHLSVESADFVASSASNVSSEVYSSAASDNHLALITKTGNSASGFSSNVLYLYDRAGGYQVASYELGTVFGLTAGATAENAKCVFVGGRYLVVFGSKYFVSIDTTASLPASAYALGLTKVAFTAGVVDIPGTYDVAVSSTRAFVCYSVAGAYYATAVTASTSTVNETLAIPGAGPGQTFICACGTNLWFTSNLGLDVGAVSLADLSVSTVASAAHGASAVTAFSVISGFVVIVLRSTPALGGTTTTRLSVWIGNAVDTAACTLSFSMDGWELASHPIGAAGSYTTRDDIFLHVTKAVSGELATHAIAQLSLFNAAVADAQSHNVARLGAVLEPYNGVSRIAATSSTLTRYLCTDSTHRNFFPVVPVRITQRSCGFAMYDVRSRRHSNSGVASFGGSDYITGGACSVSAGDQMAEAGFCDKPIMTAAQNAAGAIAIGTYSYLAVYRYVDQKSCVAYSQVSDLKSVAVTGGTKKVDAYIVPCNLSNKIDASGGFTPGLVTELYRTTSGGTTYYLVASSQVGTPLSGLLTQPLVLQASKFLLVSDNLTDAQIAVQPQLYRQPGTPNTSLDRYVPPCGNIIVQHKDRLFIADPYGNGVYYSSFFVDGEQAWFNPAFSFRVHGGNGPITGMASVDGRLVIFKKDAIFIVDGDGPSEGGPSGNEFSPPQRLATGYGCISHKSIAVTTEGVVYRSTRGVEILTRSMQVKWVGDRVQNTVDTNPYTVSTALDSFGRVHMLLASADPVTGTMTGKTGATVVWDMSSDSWSVDKYSCDGAVYGRSPQSACRANIGGLGDIIVYADPVLGVMYGDEASGVDIAAYVPTVIETSWIRTGQQARQRITDAYFLAKKVGNHAVKISAAYDYNDIYTEYVVWEPNVINTLTIEELVLQLSKPQSLAFRIKIEEQAPADTGSYPVGTGLGMAYLGVTFQVMPMVGAPHVSAGSRVGGGGTAYPEPLVSGVCDATGSEAGGVSVRVLGRGFTGATGVTFGTTAATSVVVVSDYEITCVTPAHAAGSVSVTVTGPGGSYSAPAAYTFTSSAFAGIASLNLELWFRNFAMVGGEWAGTASAGRSGTAVMVTTGADPVGSTLNGHATAAFGGTSHLKLAAFTGGTTVGGAALMARPACHFQILLKVPVLSAPSGTVYADPAVFDWASYGGLTITSAGAVFTIYDNSVPGYKSTAAVAVVAGTWILLRGGYDGQKVYLTADSAAYPAGVSSANTTYGVCNVGSNYDGTAKMDMELAEFIVSGTWFTAAEEAGIKAELNARYALAL